MCTIVYIRRRQRWRSSSWGLSQFGNDQMPAIIDVKPLDGGAPLRLLDFDGRGLARYDQSL